MSQDIQERHVRAVGLDDDTLIVKVIERMLNGREREHPRGFLLISFPVCRHDAQEIKLPGSRIDGDQIRELIRSLNEGLERAAETMAEAGAHQPGHA